MLVLAYEEAVRCDHSSIGPEHLLTGLIRADDGVAAKVLASQGVELPRARRLLEQRAADRGESETGEGVTLTAEAQRVIELAVDEARRLGHRFVGTDHLYLGLLRHDEEAGHGVLSTLGVDLKRARARTSTFLRLTDAWRLSMGSSAG